MTKTPHAIRVLLGTIALTLIVTPRLVGQALRVDFSWRVPDHFGARRSDGLVDFHWNEASIRYDTAYINPPDGWPVELNACGSIPAGSTYTWKIDGVPLPTPQPGCKLVQHFPNSSSGYLVTLTVTNAAGQRGSMTHKIVPKNWLIVSFGDSYSSGEGAPDVKQRFDAHGIVAAGPRWEDRRCHRSARSGPAQAALAIENADTLSSVTFLSFACSGARLDTGLVGPYLGSEPASPNMPPLPPQPRQADAAIHGRHIDALIVGGGINDVSFQTLLTECLSPVGCNYPGLKANFAAQLAAIVPKYEQLRPNIDALHASHVYLSGYPDPFNYADGEMCGTKHPLSRRSLQIAPMTQTLPPGLFNGIDPASVAWLRDTAGVSLNRTLSDVGARYGWIPDTVWNHFERHGECADSSDRWFNTEEDARAKEGPFAPIDVTKPYDRQVFVSKGTMHPNDNGHAEHGVVLARLLRRQLSVLPTIDVKLDPQALAGIPTSVTVSVNAPDGRPIAAKIRLNDDTVLFDANAPFLHTFHGSKQSRTSGAGGGEYSVQSVQAIPAGDYNDTHAEFAVRLQPLVARAEPSPVGDAGQTVTKDVTVRLTDARGSPVDGTVSFKDPAVLGSPASSPQTYHTNTLIKGHVFRSVSRTGRVPSNGDRCALTVATTAVVVPRDSVDYERTSKDVSFFAPQTGCDR